MSQVDQFGGNTTSVSNGSSSYIWNDVNNDGQVNKGDVIVRTAQSDASVFSYVVGHGEGMYSWGDPHMDNVAFKDGGEAAFTSSLNALFQDAKDGTLNDASLTGAVDGSLATNGVRENIGDYHADMTLALGNGRTSIEHDVVGGNIKMNENIDINLVDAEGKALTLTVKEIWSGNGGGGQMTVADTSGNTAAQAIADPADLPVMHEFRGANVTIGTVLFGDDAGTKNYAHIITADGQVDRKHGDFSMAAINYYDAWVKGDISAILSFAFGLNDEDGEGEVNPGNRRAANAPMPVAAA